MVSDAKFESFWRSLRHSIEFARPSKDGDDEANRLSKPKSVADS